VGERQSQRPWQQVPLHSSAYWSGVYYVDYGGVAVDASLGGELEFMDQRGPVPVMNAPHLRMSGGPSAGATERVQPKSGRMVLAWMMHQVRPYRGISIAFNLTV
jgi:hypothetical protein